MNTNSRRQIIKYIGAIAGTALTLPAKSLAYAACSFSPYGEQKEQVDFQILNSGVGGNNTVDMLRRIHQDCLVHKPKLTILMAGTNDMNSVKHIPLKEYEKNMKDMINRIKASSSKVLLMTILPCYEPDLLTRHPAAFYQPEGVAGRRKELNNIVKQIATEQKTFLLNLEHRFEAIGKVGAGMDSLLQNQANSNKKDGIHPTANGYRFIGLTVYDFIIYHKLPTSMIVCFGDSITKGDGSIDRDSYPAYLNKLLST